MAYLAKGAKIFGGSFGATVKSGFGVQHGSPVEKAPKLTDQFFVTFETSISNLGKQGLDIYSSKVKSVSGATINTTYITLDQYGKRVNVPTRVDFGPVTITMYDTVDGNTFKLVSDIYEHNFKNNTIKTDGGALAQSIVDPMQQGAKHSGSQELHYFSRVIIHDFFGDVANKGKRQKIEVINPLITNISFSDSDYSNGADVKMITLTLQPENLLIEDASLFRSDPSWLQDGLDYIDTETNPNAGTNNLYDSKAIAALLSSLIEETEGFTGDPFSPPPGQPPGSINSLTKAFIGTDVTDTTKTVDTEGYDGNPFAPPPGQPPGNVASVTRGLRGGDEGAAAQQAELDALLKLYNTTKTAPTEEAREAAEEEFLDKRHKAGPIRAGFTDDLTIANRAISNRNPEIAGLADSISQAIGAGNTSIGASFNNALKSELVNSFFNGTSFDLGSLATKVAAGQIGNTGVGNAAIQNRTSSSKFGLAGDILRDSISDAVRTSSTPTVTSGAGATSDLARDIKQAGISAFINGIRRR